MTEPQENNTTPEDHAVFASQEEAENRLAASDAETAFGSEENATKTGQLITRFVSSWQERDRQKTDEQWLIEEFHQYPGIWKDEEDISTTAREIVHSIEENTADRASLQAHLDAGKSQASWLANRIEAGAKAAGVAQVGIYAGQIDAALKQSTDQFRRTVTTGSGQVSVAYNLDGFIAEQHHANTFNIEAQASGSSYRAEVLRSNTLNSPDVVIRDANGTIVRRYQLKYGADAQATENMLSRGNYEGQEVVVSSDQTGQIPGSRDVIEFDGVTSKPLTKAEVKEMQRQVQQQAEFKQYEWNEVNRITIAKQIGKQALIMACVTAGLQGARILGRRVWNTLTGKENPPASEDLKEFFHSSIKSTANAGVQIAVSGAVVVAAKNGFIKILQNTPAGKIANLVYVGMENVKVLYKLAKGELNATEAMDTMGNVTCAALGGLEGAVTGATLGMALGPVGSFVGAVVGGMAGSVVGEAVYAGAKIMAKTVANVAETLWEGARETVKEMGRVLNPLRWFA